MKLELVQVGEGAVRDLFIWSMGDVQAILRKGAPKDAIVYYFNGAGTSSYENPPSVDDIKKFVAAHPAFGDAKFGKVTLMGWSAGGRAVQNQLIAAGKKSQLPDAILIADGTYAGYINPQKKTIDTTKLRPLVDYFALAALKKTICVIWHSDIFTPGYASSGECCEWIKAQAEEKLGIENVSTVIPPYLDGRGIKSYYQLGNAVMIGYAGKDKAEHIAEVNMIDEVMQHFLPWASDDNKAIVEDFIYDSTDEIEPAVIATPSRSISYGERCLDMMRAYRDSAVREYDMIVTRMLRMFGVSAPNNWCAVAVGEVIDRVSREAGLTKPIAGSAGAKATMGQFQKAGKWFPFKAEMFESLRPGMVVVYDRHDPSNPASQPWWGHIEFIESLSVENGKNLIHTIGGNVNNKVDRAKHEWKPDNKILGVGSLD